MARRRRCASEGRSSWRISPPSLHTTARLGVVEGVEVAYVEKKAGVEPGTLFPNPARLPLHATAMGKALLAFGHGR